MKALRILGLAFGVLLALVAVLLGALYALFDGEKLKAELTRVVMEQKQRKLDIAGPLELSVWPDVGIKLGRLTLSEPGGKEGFLALDAARVAVAVMPLLSKQVQVQRIEVDGLKATLVKRKDGTLNIADLAGGAADKEGAAKDSQKSAPAIRRHRYGSTSPASKSPTPNSPGATKKPGRRRPCPTSTLAAGACRRTAAGRRWRSRPWRSRRKARPAPTVSS
jgi:uncharacterized protein involved in outer membrane biogenesis